MSTEAALAWGGLLIGIVGIALAVWAWRSPRTDVQLRFGCREKRLAPTKAWRKVEGLETLFRGEAVEFVDELQIAFRNFGPGRINHGDTECSVRVVLPGEDGRIRLLESTHAVQVSDRVIEIDLEGMNVGAVRTARIVHDIPRVSEASIVVTGAIRNVPRGIQRGVANPGSSLADWLMVGLLILMVVTMGAIAWSESYDEAFVEDGGLGWSTWMAWCYTILAPIVVALSFLIPSALIWAGVRFISRAYRRALHRRRSPFGGE